MRESADGSIAEPHAAEKDLVEPTQEAHPPEGLRIPGTLIQDQSRPEAHKKSPWHSVNQSRWPNYTIWNNHR
jgi:hypothetical protein